VVGYIGMDVHREFAQLAVVEDGVLRDEGRIGVSLGCCSGSVS
jgi:transposase